MFDITKIDSFKKRIMITGGAGFIGSHCCRYFVNKYPDYLIVNFDALTYAGNLENLRDIETKDNYCFVLGDIRKSEEVSRIFERYKITDVIHLAAESHVDRSIKNPNVFVETNVLGTLNLLNVAKEFWKEDYSKHRFHHISTDEVYGSLSENEHPFKETNKYMPHSPYSASKASSDHFVRAFHDTYGLNVTISNCSNNYGPNQFPEKLIPLVINNILNSKEIPVYGNGLNIRDWLYVEDHTSAIDLIFHKGINGETYNVGGHNEKTNLDIINDLIDLTLEVNKKTLKNVILKPRINFIQDRLGHDKRYAIDNTKIKTLGWKPANSYKKNLEKTVRWYLKNQKWLENVTNGEYQNYYKTMYKNGE